MMRDVDIANPPKPVNECGRRARKGDTETKLTIIKTFHLQFLLRRQNPNQLQLRRENKTGTFSPTVLKERRSENEKKDEKASYIQNIEGGFFLKLKFEFKLQRLLPVNHTASRSVLKPHFSNIQ